MVYKEFFEIALEGASQIANDKFGKVVGTRKPDNSILTEADIAVGKYIIEKISAAYPDYNIIDEESGVIDKNSEYTFVIDPIDGTSNYSLGLPMYGILIGLLKGATPVAGGIALPFFHDIIIAEKGEGAYCKGEKLHVNMEQDIHNSYMVYNFGNLYTTKPQEERKKLLLDECLQLADILPAVKGVRSSNSVFDVAMTAKGKYSGVTNRVSKIWDNIAQHIVIEEAGGIYTDFTGKPMNYNDPLTRTKDNFDYCAASPSLHKQLQSIIHKE